MRVIYIIFLTFISFSFIPGISLGEIVRNDLFGHFRYENTFQSCEMYLEKDGFYYGNCAQNNRIIWQYSGAWKLDGDILKTLYTSSTAVEVPPGTKDRDKVIKLNKDYLILENQSGKISKYRRLKSSHLTQ